MGKKPGQSNQAEKRKVKLKVKIGESHECNNLSEFNLFKSEIHHNKVYTLSSTQHTSHYSSSMHCTPQSHPHTSAHSVMNMESLIRNCLYCDSSFKPKESDQRYCNILCRCKAKVNIITVIHHSY